MDGPGIIKDETGAQTLLGYVVDISKQDGKGRCVLDTGPQHTNRHGGLHGGIIVCMLDNAMGYAASLYGDPDAQTKFMTISMATQFLSPAREGRIIATGTVTGGGQKIVFVDGVLHDENGRLLATASGAFKRLQGDAA